MKPANLVEGYNEGVNPDGCRWASMVRNGHVVWSFVDAKQESMEDMLRQLPGYGAPAKPENCQFGGWQNLRVVLK